MPFEVGKNHSLRIILFITIGKARTTKKNLRRTTIEVSFHPYSYSCLLNFFSRNNSMVLRWPYIPKTEVRHHTPGFPEEFFQLKA